MKIGAIVCLVAILLLSFPTWAQYPPAQYPPAPRPGAPTRPQTGPVQNPAVTPGGVGDIQTLLRQIEQAAQQTSRDIAALRIEKWKADGAMKGQLQANAESIQRNLTAALPTIVQQVQAAPDDLAASFKLYRNLGALYDVLSSLGDAATALGSKNEAQALSVDLNAFDNARRVLGDRVATLASIKESEIARLSKQVKAAAQAAAAAAPPKKIVVDEEEKPKKAVKKKKPTPPPQASNTQQQ